MTRLRQGVGVPRLRWSYGEVHLRQGFGVTSCVVALAVASGLAVFGVVRGTWAVGGSDSSCYALMAQAFSQGHLQPAPVLAAEAPWPNAAVTFAPGGFIPSTIRPDASAPICAPGFSVLMAPLAMAFGQDAIFWLTPLAGFVLVMSAFAIARRLAGGMAGAAAAILTATSPIVLYQAVQPMNDIVTAALWLAALVFAHRPVVSGALMGVAILVRPNLAPLALVLAAMPLIHHGRNTQAWRAVTRMLAAALPGVVLLLALNRALYGSPIASGYGDLGTLFRVSHVNDNLTNFGHALWQTQNIVPAIGLLAPVVFKGDQRRMSVTLLIFAVTVTSIYLLYSPFPEWWYLRFLIPAITVLLILASAVAVTLLSKASMGGLIPIVAVVLGIFGTRAAGEREAFALLRLEGRYRQTAELVRDRLPSNAVLITEWQSGGMRFHAGRDVVLWQSLDPAWLDRALAWLRSKGLQPYLLFERREERDFRERFRGHGETGALDWPPRFDLNRQIRIYDPADRARFLAGESYATENTRLR